MEEENVVYKFFKSESFSDLFRFSGSLSGETSPNVDKDVVLSDVIFHGEYKGMVTLSQNGNVKAEASCDEPLKEIRFAPPTLLEPGPFTLSSDWAYTYIHGGLLFETPVLPTANR